jgi:hypothetical protein
MYAVSLFPLQAIYGHLNATTLVRSSWYIYFFLGLWILTLYLIGLVRGLQHGFSKGAVEPERSVFNHPAYHGLLSTSCSLPFFWPNLPLVPPDLSQTSAWSLRLLPLTTTM